MKWLRKKFSLIIYTILINRTILYVNYVINRTILYVNYVILHHLRLNRIPQIELLWINYHCQPWSNLYTMIVQMILCLISLLLFWFLFPLGLSLFMLFVLLPRLDYGVLHILIPCSSRYCGTNSRSREGPTTIKLKVSSLPKVLPTLL